MATTLYVGTAFAQQQDQLESVTVTAQRTRQQLQDVPMTVQAISLQQLKIEGISTGQQLTNMVPGLTVGSSATPGIESQVTIRGIPEVGLYVDGIWQPDIGFREGGMVELQRVEILYGPQGTLFGRNTNGGAINYITTPPADKFGVHGSFEIGSFQHRFVDVSVDVPFGDTLLTKWTAAIHNQGGWAKSLLTGKMYGGHDNKVFRGDILWQPASNFSLRLTAQDSSIVGSDDYINRIYPGLSDTDYGDHVAYNIAVMNPAYGPYTWYTGSTEWLSRFKYGNELDPQHDSWGYPNGPAGGLSPNPLVNCGASVCTGPGRVGKWENTMNAPTDSQQYQMTEWTTTATWNINSHTTFTNSAAYIDNHYYYYVGVQHEALVIWPMVRKWWYRYYQEEAHLSGDLFDNKVNYLVGFYWLHEHDLSRTTASGMPQFMVASDPSNPVLDNGNHPIVDQTLIDFIHQWGQHMAGTPIGNTIDNWTGQTYAKYMATWVPNFPYFGQQGPSYFGDVGSFAGKLTNATTDDHSLFANVTWHVLSDLDIQGGLRMSWINGVSNSETPTGAFQTFQTPIDCSCYGYGPGNPFAGGPPTNTTDPYPGGVTFTPMATITYHWTPAVNTYFRYAQGYTSPSKSFNSQVNITYDLPPETVSDYEGGLRADWLNNRLRTNASVYWYNWAGQRITEFFGTSQGLTTFTAAAGESRAYGFEGEVDALPLPGLQLTAQLAYLNTKYLKQGTSKVAPGAPWPYSPRWMFHLAAQYDIELPNMSDLTLRADYGHMSSYVQAADPTVAHGPEPAYGILNARIQYTPADAHWNVGLFGTNLTDTAYVTNGSGGNSDQGVDPGTLGERRMWGVRVSFDY